MTSARIAHWEGCIGIYPDRDLRSYMEGRAFRLDVIDRTILLEEVPDGNTGHYVDPARCAGYGLLYEFSVLSLDLGLARFCLDRVELEGDDGLLAWTIPEDHSLPWPHLRGSSKSMVAARELAIRLRSACQCGVDPKEVTRRVPERVRQHIGRETWAEIVRREVGQVFNPRPARRHTMEFSLCT
ncbi:hypothetical protein ELZ19_06855 [Brucella abortus]|nr:hypothetical protein IB60_17390 [Brucella abortus LMN1]RUQ96512.1 hypothetical protein ELZ21_15490 [Brucella abortus]RUR06641.1 hypothetical protein ELZ19_06855 [Brucella abortus]